MDAQIIQAIVAPAFLLVGLSHLLQPESWIDFFAGLKASKSAGIVIATYTLPVALLLIVGHNDWRWDWPLFLTLAGWIMGIKCALYLLVPGLAGRMLARSAARSRPGFRCAGLIMAFFGAILTWRSVKILALGS
jgi:hypothetical protein